MIQQYIEYMPKKTIQQQHLDTFERCTCKNCGWIQPVDIILKELESKQEPTDARNQAMLLNLISRARDPEQSRGTLLNNHQCGLDDPIHRLRIWRSSGQNPKTQSCGIEITG